MDKLSETFHKKWINNSFYNDKIIDNIDKKVQLHKDIKSGVSSAAACINVLGNLSKSDLLNYLNSIDGFVLAKINNKITQILIEWKFTETYSSDAQVQKFAGFRGNERLKRYSTCLAQLRKSNDFPFQFKDDGGIGLYDFGYEPIYQLLRMTLLSKMTTPINIGHLNIEDYRILHITHSDNNKLNILSESNLRLCPGLDKYSGQKLHDVWIDLLSDNEKSKFRFGYWNQSIDLIGNSELKQYLRERYK